MILSGEGYGKEGRNEKGYTEIGGVALEIAKVPDFHFRLPDSQSGLRRRRRIQGPLSHVSQNTPLSVISHQPKGHNCNYVITFLSLFFSFSFYLNYNNYIYIYLKRTYLNYELINC